MTGRPQPSPPRPDNEDEVLDELRGRIRWRGDQTEIAGAIGVSPSTLTHILRDGVRVSDRVAAFLGYRRVVRWERMR